MEILIIPLVELIGLFVIPAVMFVINLLFLGLQLITLCVEVIFEALFYTRSPFRKKIL